MGANKSLLHVVHLNATPAPAIVITSQQGKVDRRENGFMLSTASNRIVETRRVEKEGGREGENEMTEFYSLNALRRRLLLLLMMAVDDFRLCT